MWFPGFNFGGTIDEIWNVDFYQSLRIGYLVKIYDFSVNWGRSIAYIIEPSETRDKDQGSRHVLEMVKFPSSRSMRRF